MNDKDIIPNRCMQWDDEAIHQRSLSFPEALQEPYRWLASFTATECRKSPETLANMFKQVGVERDRSTWSRILRGQWQHNDGRRAAPVVKEDVLLDEIDALRQHIKREAQRGRIPFIITTVSQSIFTYMNLKRVPHRVNRFGIIVGHTGTGKSETFRHYKQEHNHGRTSLVEAPENGSIKEIVGRLVREHRLGGNNIGEQRLHLVTRIGRDRLIIVDNAQDLYNPRKGHHQPAFQFFRRLQDETGCCIIFSITPTFDNVLQEGMMAGYFEQFEGRAGGRSNFLRLPEYPPEEDCVTIAKAFGMKDAGRHRKYLAAIAREPGRIRRLFEDLQEALLIAESEKKPLTIEHISEARGDEA